MSALAALVAFVFWTMSLVGAIGVARVGWVLKGDKRPNGFPSGTEHGPGWYWRLNRAHMNCVETLPVFGALVLVAHLAEIEVDLLATVVVAARVGQTLAHVSSGRSLAVNVRFAFFSAQILACVVMAVKLLAALL